MNASVYAYNEGHLFSIAQRLIKFESGCLNSMFKYVNECKDPTPDECILHSPGFLALRNYAQILYEQNEPNPRINADTKFVLKVIEEYYPRYEDRKKDFFDKANYDYATHTTRLTICIN